MNCLRGSSSSFFFGKFGAGLGKSGELTTRICGVVGVASLGVLGLGVVVGLTPHLPNTQPPTFLPMPSADAGFEFAELAE